MSKQVPATRAAVVERYSGLARLVLAGGTPTDCDADACETGASSPGCSGADAYPGAQAPEAALRASLGCGNPLQVAAITPGQTVLDLGSGGGLDVILSARRTGPTGKVYGLDASADMLALAAANAADAGVGNVEWLHGHIEDIPLPGASVDVIISNCVINLSADKTRVLAEAFRVLKPGGRFGVSDVITDGNLTADQRAAAGQRTGCAAGALTTSEYRHALLTAGFTAPAITPTHQAAPGLASALVHAAKPAAPRDDAPSGRRAPAPTRRA